MNKMIQRRVVKFDTKEQYNVSFFDDDTIEVVRQQIGIATDIHPNRLLVFAKVKLPNEYYVQDPRRWEALFDRLSLTGQVLDKDIFTEFQTQYRFPNMSIPFNAYSKDDWMSIPSDLQKLFSPDSDFMEYRILGVEESKSFILPLSGQHKRISQIPSSNLPIAEVKRLLYNFYKASDIDSFIFRPYTDMDESVARTYYPFLQSNTPPRITEETARLLQTNAKLLNELLDIKVPDADAISIIRARFIIPFVTTNFGSAVRTRFEQIFYGVTLSEEVPYVQFFTSKTESNRHKFYVENPKQKKPFLDVVMLKQWLNETKPQRNRPTLMFYRGSSRNDYDKISITATEMIVTVYRDTKNKQTIENIKKQSQEWISTFDAVNAFIDPTDLKEYRWVLDDLKFLAKYKNEVDDIDLRRFNCISPFFGIIDKQNTFRMLRTDHSNDGISAVELKLLQMKKDSPLLTPADIQTELGVPKEKAVQLLDALERRIDDDPSLTERAFRGFPILHLEPTSILFSFTDNLERSIKYANLLRYVLSNPKSKILDDICPKRMETIEVKSLTEPVFEPTGISEYDDLFAELEGDIVEQKDDATVKTESVRVGKQKDTLHSYFSTRLREFDPATFSSSDYPRECERKRQPIIVTENEIDKNYDPRKYLGPESIIEVKNPDGHILCPEYWCMKDLIPLREQDLDSSDGIVKCPKCGGKLRKTNNDDIREFTVIKRDQAYKYPGFKTSAAVKFPCCFTTPQAKRALKKEEKEDDKYYILLEKRENIKPFRFAFLPKTLINSLSLNETYELLKNVNNRIQNGLAGYFRVGIGNAIETLPDLLDIKTKISAPIDSIETVLKCSFLSTWKRISTSHIERIEYELKDKITNELSRKNVAQIISGIQDAYEKKELSPLHELEYATLFLQCDVFRIFTETNSMGCMFHSFMNRPKNRAIIILQNNSDIDILCNVRRIANLFKYRSNIYQTPFKKETQDEVERLRNISCRTKLPTYNDALNAMPDLLTHLESDTYEIILDPYGRGQAFFIKHKLVLPFQSTPLPSVIQAKISGYNDIDPSDFPDYETVKKYLIIAEGYSKGYAWKEDIFDADKNRIEILIESGLPIAIKPEASESVIESKEVTNTIRKYDESELVFGGPSAELETVRKDISYSAEVFEFLLFELSNDMFKDDEYSDLKNTLTDNHPVSKKVEPLLKKWFNKTTHFVDIDEPATFLSKVRVPCGQFTKSKCSGALCGWDGNVCKTKIDNKLQKDRVFHRLLTTLVENVKIRSVVLDHRVTPFFSTILYLDLPHELIYSDSELSSSSL